MTFLKYFKTGGIRGKVGENPIHLNFLLKLGWAIGIVLGKNKTKKFIIGRDTRISGCMLQSALEAGILSTGISTVLVGCIPTSAVSFLIRSLNASVGIVISGSHNLFEYNGIKIFYKNGVKLKKDLELSIEKQLKCSYFYPCLKTLGKSSNIIDAEERYINFCKKTFPEHLNLSKFTIVLDCAHGATYNIAPRIFKDLGAVVITSSASPDGININKNSGSTDLLKLKKLVLSEQADIGLAFDGDGDRVIMIDHLGNEVDGDQIVYIIAKEYLRYNKINSRNGVVGTLMTNMGIILGLKKIGIPFYATKVGDGYIYKKMKEKKCILGAEKSGHIILLDKHSTGDGIIASLQILFIMIDRNMSLYNLWNQVKILPQISLNVFFEHNNDFKNNIKVKNILSKSKKILGLNSRIFLRKSGTEPCIRIMVEGENFQKVHEIAYSIKHVIKNI